jgi:hypothetical protein
VGISLRRCQSVVDCEPVFPDHVADNRVAVADGRIAVDNVRQLAARRGNDGYNRLTTLWTGCGKSVDDSVEKPVHFICKPAGAAL